MMGTSNPEQPNITYPNDTWDAMGYYTNGPVYVPYNVRYAVNGITVPIIGLLGIVGNLLNLGILSWRSWKREDDTLEKVALVGLIALAASDMCFCLTIVPNFTEYDNRITFEGRSFSFYYKLYGNYVQNVFIKTSTWLTMVVACARYIAICHPLHARISFGLTTTKVAIVSTFLFWSILLLPYLWEFSVLPYTMNNRTNYIIDLGPFTNSQVMWDTFTYIWAFTGYFMPVVILAFCNVCLIHALRESRLLRESIAVSSRSGANNARRSNRRITMTLVALVVMFMVLISPSEILHFCHHVGYSFRLMEVGVLVTNVLQAINFAFHFVLYCAVNVAFRRTLVTFGYVLVSYLRAPRLGRKRTRDSFSGRSTFLHSVLRSNETNISRA